MRTDRSTEETVTRPKAVVGCWRCSTSLPRHPVRRTITCSMRRSKRLVALVVGLALVAAACRGDDDETGATEAPSDDTSGSGDDDRRDFGFGDDHRRDVGHHRGRWRDDRPAARRRPVRRDDRHGRHQPGRRLGGRLADHGGGLRVHVAGPAEHAGLDPETAATTDHVRRRRARATSRSSSSSTRPYAPVQDDVRRHHQEGVRRGLQRHLRRLRTELPISGRAVHDRVVESESRSMLVAQPGVLGRRTPVAERIVMVPRARPGNRDRRAQLG